MEATEQPQSLPDGISTKTSEGTVDPCSWAMTLRNEDCQDADGVTPDRVLSRSPSSEESHRRLTFSYKGQTTTAQHSWTQLWEGKSSELSQR